MKIIEKLKEIQYDIHCGEMSCKGIDCNNCPLGKIAKMKWEKKDKYCDNCGAPLKE